MIKSISIPRKRDLRRLYIQSFLQGLGNVLLIGGRPVAQPHSIDEAIEWDTAHLREDLLSALTAATKRMSQEERHRLREALLEAAGEEWIDSGVIKEILNEQRLFSTSRYEGGLKDNGGSRERTSSRANSKP